MSTDRQAPSLRALRGATTVESDSAEAITSAVAELLEILIERNEIAPRDVVSIIFTSTQDLTAAFPAAAARALGLSDVPLLCTAELNVPGALPRCVRVLLHLYTDRDYATLRHVYLRDARTLREDLADPP